MIRSHVRPGASASALALSILSFAALPVPAVAGDGGAPILRARVISNPGAYEVRRNFSADESGDALVIAASNVTVNLAGHTLSGKGATEGVGIRIMPGVSNVRVFGGALTGFGVGVQVEGASNVRVEDLQISGGDLGGPPPGQVGVLLVNARAVVVERNVVTGTFLGVFVRGSGSGGNRIASNTLTGGAAGQLGICYNPDGSGNDIGPSGDLVYNNLVSRFVLGIQTSAGTAGNVFTENTIAASSQAIQEVTAGSNVFADNQSTLIVP
jgi:nitrous oxidase accessory protein NosD